MYLAAIPDLCSHVIVDRGMNKTKTDTLTQQALRQAILWHSPPKDKGLIVISIGEVNVPVMILRSY